MWTPPPGTSWNTLKINERFSWSSWRCLLSPDILIGDGVSRFLYCACWLTVSVIVNWDKEPSRCYGYQGHVRFSSKMSRSRFSPALHRFLNPVHCSACQMNFPWRWTAAAHTVPFPRLSYEKQYVFFKCVSMKYKQNALSTWLQSKSRNPPWMRMQKRKKNTQKGGTNAQKTKWSQGGSKRKRQTLKGTANFLRNPNLGNTWQEAGQRETNWRKTKGKADHTHTRWRQPGQGGLIKQVCIQKGSQERKKVRTK